VSCSDFVDRMAGGDTIQRLGKIPEFEVTMPNQADRLMMTAEVGLNQDQITVHVTAVISPQIDSSLCAALAMQYVIIRQYTVKTKAAMPKTFKTQDLAYSLMTAAP